jgi:MFS family permease
MHAFQSVMSCDVIPSSSSLLVSSFVSFLLELYGASVFVAVPMLLLTFRIPRSKRWLLMHGRRQEALESMQFVYKGDVHSEFTSMATSIALSRTASMPNEDGTISAGRGPSLFSSDYRKAMVASMGLIIFQQFSGQPSVLSYATVLFQAAGWSGNASVVMAVLMMFMSMSTVVLVDKLGRKRMLCFCCIVMMTALSALSTSLWGWNGQQQQQQVDESSSSQVELPTIQKLTILVAMFVYIGGFQLGFGPITWTIVSEIFPLEIRGRAIAFGVELNYLLNFLVQFGFPIIQETIGWGMTFSLFATILAFAFFFIREFVPETTGLTLEEIQAQLTTATTTATGDRNGADRYSYVSPEETRLLPSMDSQLLVGLAPNLEEMESELTRRDSSHAMTEKGELGI